MLDRKTKTRSGAKRKQFYKGTIQSRAPNKPEDLSLQSIKFVGDESTTKEVMEWPSLSHIQPEP